MAIVSRSKFADTILEEAAAFFCFVYAGLADGYVFGKITQLDTDTNRRLQELHRTRSTVHWGIFTA